MRRASPTGWCPACRSKPASKPETAGAREFAGARELSRACAPFGFNRADAAVATDFHPMAGTGRGAHGHFHIRAEWAPFDVRSFRYSRRGERRIRRGRVDHHGADHGTDVRYAGGHLDGRCLWASTVIDRCLDRLCDHLAPDPLRAQLTHAADAAVSGWTGLGILHTAHLELHPAEHTAEVL